MGYGEPFEFSTGIFAFGFVFQTLSFATSAFVAPLLLPGFFKRNRTTTSLKYQARAQIASITHSIFAMCVSLYMMYTMRHDDESVVYRGVNTVDEFAQNFAAGTFMGHLFSDAAYSIIFRSKMKDYKLFWPMLFHHSIFAFALYLNTRGPEFYFLGGFSVLYLSEASSIPLAIRWLMIKYGNTKSLLFTITNAIFVLSYFVLRVVLYGNYVFGILSHLDVALHVLSPAAQISALLQIAGFGLQLYWFVGIAQSVAGVFSGKRSAGKKK